MDKELTDLQTWLTSVAEQLQSGTALSMEFYEIWVERPTRVLTLVDLIDGFVDRELDAKENEYSACIVAMDICVANLQSAYENGQKSAERLLHELMQKLSDKILEKKHDVSFWMPIINSFYDAQVELSPALKNAYLILASESDKDGDEVEDNLDNIRDLIQELSHNNDFEIAAHIFAQSHVMPPEFFAELLCDLLSLDEGQDIALLSLLHPCAEIRAIVVEVLDQMLPSFTLSSLALSWIQSMRDWYPQAMQPMFKRWIKEQRRKGVTYYREAAADKLRVVACEIDGTGTQGMVLRFNSQKIPMVAGILFKKNFGIKDIWVSAFDTARTADAQFNSVFNDGLYARHVKLDYVQIMMNHFLYETLSQGQVPDLQLLHLESLLGLHFKPEQLAAPSVIQQMCVQIHPFTPDIIDQALKKSAGWHRQHPFSRSWFEESPEIDRVVNQYCSFEKGTKICDLTQAVDEIFREVFAKERDKWRFHFLWNAMFLHSNARARERSWKDCLLIAYYIDQGNPLKDIPIMRTIAQQSVINSMETMLGRGTYLTTL